MANTRDTLGEQATLDGLVARTLTTLEEDGVDSVNDYALCKCNNLTNIKMPNVIKCGQYAFSETGLTEITADSFPAMTTIENYGFSSCSSLTKARFDAVSSFSYNCFYDCPKLEELILLNNSKVRPDSSALTGTPIAVGFGVVYVPRTLVDSYKADNVWKKYTIAAYEDYPVVLGTITDTWSQILAAEADGSYLTKYKIGDTKFQKIGDKLFDFEIVAFDKDDLADGSGKAHITWIAKHIVFDAQMNASKTNSGGWANCKLRSDLRAMLDSSSADIKAAVKEVNKTYYNYTTSKTETIADTIWIPSMYEVDSTYTPRESSGVIYDDVFTNSNANTRVKYNMRNSSSYWWTRSAYSSSSTFWYIAGGASSGGSANLSYGVVPGLCT